MTHHANTQDQFGLRIAAQLNSASLELPHDISERLRAARTRAVAARLMPQTRLQTSQASLHQNGVGMLHFGDEGLNIWSRLASFLPLIALVAGLVLIQSIMDDDRANELAEVTAAKSQAMGSDRSDVSDRPAPDSDRGSESASLPASSISPNWPPASCGSFLESLAYSAN